MRVVSKQTRKIRINCTIEGEVAEILAKLKKRGIFGSNREAVVQALLAFNQKIVEQDLKQAQLKNLHGLTEDR